MKTYHYYTFGTSNDYGQVTLSSLPVGTIKIAINLLSQNTTNNIQYMNAKYIGLTKAEVNDTYVIDCEKGKLKVLYVNDMGRYKQVYLSEYTS